MAESLNETAPSKTESRRLRWLVGSPWIQAAGAGALYFAAARLGTALHLQPTQIAIAWPAAGVAVAILLLADPRRWWLYAAAIGATNTAANLAVGSSLFTSVGASLADVLKAVGSAWLMRAIAPRRVDMTDVRHVVGLGAAVGLVSPFCALLGALTAPP